MVPLTQTYSSTVICSISTVSRGSSRRSVGTAPISSTTSIPSMTCPKTACLPPSRCGVASSVMKNCEPFVFGPEFAMEEDSRTVVSQIVVELVVELVARAAAAALLRVAALNHEVLDDAVEDVPLVQRVASDLAAFGVLPRVRVTGGIRVGGGVVTRQSEEVLDRLRRAVGEQLDDDVAAGSCEASPAGCRDWKPLVPCLCGGAPV